MRFSELSLERYGRFEDCRLVFRSGAPDLHVIQGPNEAGKSTTLAAVSDLLFGFSPRSPYNFRFDYNLLRVGAVVEADGVSHALRRRKGNAGSLVDAGDKPIDEGPLLAMLKGQSRETFRLAFSLDHTRLREGGQAILDAKDDLGRAIFAAGSGMSGVAAVLASLEAEADTIWGPRASQRRTYTAAKAACDDATKLLRTQELRPKAWTDARRSLDQQIVELEELEARRRAMSADQRRLDRLRRISPHARRREELVAAVAARDGTALLSVQAEAAAETALAAIAEEDRKHGAAVVLLAEAEARMAQIGLDDAILAMAERIEAAVAQSGAERKAAHDLVRIKEEARVHRRRIAALEAELGLSGPDGSAALPSRIGVAQLRALSQRSAQDARSVSEVEQSLAHVEARAAPVRERLAGIELDAGLPALSAAVDAARALGADIDTQVARHAQAAELASAAAEIALARLNPWSGAVDALALLPDVADAEIDAVHAALARLKEGQDAEAATIQRLADELARLSLQRETLTNDGLAVSAEAVAAARAEREARWRPMHTHLIEGTRPVDSKAATDAFEEAVAEADRVADRRFTLAEASGQLAAVDLRRATLELERELAQARHEQAAAALSAAQDAWQQRLFAAGLPTLPPMSLRAWTAGRSDALSKEATAKTSRKEAEEARRRVADARDRLIAALGPTQSIDGDGLAPVLELAESRRRTGEDRVLAFNADRNTLRDAEEEIADLRRRLAVARSAQASTAESWRAECVAAGVNLPIDGAEARLTVIEELGKLREMHQDLDRRIEGINRDARAFAEEVNALCEVLGVPHAEPARRVEALQKRLSDARAAGEALRQLRATADARKDECDRAAAARNAAIAALAPVLAQTGLSDPSALPEAIAASRDLRALRESLAQNDRAILEAGDGYAVPELLATWRGQDPDRLASEAESMAQDLEALNRRITEAGVNLGEARRTLETLEGAPSAANALADAQLARAEMDAQAEAYLLKRTEAVMLRWAIERYRERHQNPLLTRAAGLFETLTLGRYVGLQVDAEGGVPRLLALGPDRATVVDVNALSEGTVDQLFLALRIAAVEQSIAAGVHLPFLADDLFVNFDDERAAAGFRVLAELARSTQVLFFTHHAHLTPIARAVVGADTFSECTLG